MRSRKLVLLFVACAWIAFPATAAGVLEARFQQHAAKPVLGHVTTSAASATDTRAVAAAAPRLEAVDGGVGYYARFSHSLPSSREYFPVAVWGSYNHTQANRNLDAAAGINTYVWVADSSFMDQIRADGRFRVIQAQEEARSAVGSESAGWLLADEIDMNEANAAGAAVARQQLTGILGGLPGDGRLRFTNYGKGVIFWNDDADAERYVNDFQHVTSDDIYWHSDAGDDCTQYQGGKLMGVARPLTEAECRRSANYGYTVDRLRELDGKDGVRHPIWNFVEVGHPFSDGDSIKPAEVRAAVWHSIIAGARGILYFQHSFGGPCVGDHHVLRSNCEGTRPVVASVDRQIKSLAPVLNSPTVSSAVSTSASIRAMTKWDGQHLYVFAGSRNNAASTGTWSLPCVGSAKAVRLGESGTVPVTNGTLSDRFADGNAIHVYRIDGGSTCGLTPGIGSPGGGPGSGDRLRVVGSPGRTRITRLPRRVSLRSGRLMIRVRCATTCTVRSRLTTRRGPRRLLLAAARRRFTAGRHKLVLRLSRRDRRVARGRPIRLRTVIVVSGGRVERTQRLVAQR